jgi:hypothetical protein
MANGTFNDNDKLDMEGDWEIMYGYVAGPLDKNKSQHHRPHGYSVGAIQTYALHFNKGVPGNNGGSKYTGNYTSNPLITLTAETYYDKRGRQQVFIVAHNKALQAIELHCGTHVRYASDPRGLHVVGGWGNGGWPLGDIPSSGNGSNVCCQFVMTKGKFKDD